MVGKRKDVSPINNDSPVYPIGVAARLIGVHARTLRIYEAEGLVRPAHKGNRRMFSQNDISWITCLRSIIHEQGISIPGLKKLLKLVPCWEVAECSHSGCGGCEASVDWAEPRSLHPVGDEDARVAAKQKDLEKRERREVPGKKQVSPG